MVIMTGRLVIHVDGLMRSYVIPNARLIRTCMQPFSKRPQARFVHVYMCIWGRILVTANVHMYMCTCKCMCTCTCMRTYVHAYGGLYS